MNVIVIQYDISVSLFVHSALIGHYTLYIDVKYKCMNRPVNALKSMIMNFVDDSIGFEVKPYFISYCYGVMLVDLYEECIMR